MHEIEIGSEQAKLISAKSKVGQAKSQGLAVHTFRGRHYARAGDMAINTLVSISLKAISFSLLKK